MAILPRPLLRRARHSGRNATRAREAPAAPRRRDRGSLVCSDTSAPFASASDASSFWSRRRRGAARRDWHPMGGGDLGDRSAYQPMPCRARFRGRVIISRFRQLSSQLPDRTLDYAWRIIPCGHLLVRAFPAGWPAASDWQESPWESGPTFRFLRCHQHPSGNTRGLSTVLSLRNLNVFICWSVQTLTHTAPS